MSLATRLPRCTPSALISAVGLVWVRRLLSQLPVDSSVIAQTAKIRKSRLFATKAEPSLLMKSGFLSLSSILLPKDFRHILSHFKQRIINPLMPSLVLRS
ncbi:hypothetical protein TSAR_008531 [Trichomalopsis sarcophagae]|uniref:Uncharacterized protein n=1 Tax=Trichomalopsis sarcophagae TaxID=543379 RepID=A0A232EWJ3_9HYME|nr:hypothetical protein TSAR_008531 [Trichomalopsis sarcophagae]